VSDTTRSEDVTIDIAVEDLHALAKINPLAWEQLLHIVDNRQKDERIAELEGHLAHAHDSMPIEHRVVTKAELDRIEAKNGSTEVA